MLDWCLIIGIIFIAIAAIMMVLFFAPTKTPQVSKKGKAAGNKRLSSLQPSSEKSFFTPDSDFILNLDAFCDPDLIPANVQEIIAPSAPSTIFVTDDDLSDDAINHHGNPNMPSMNLASLLEVQQTQAFCNQDTSAVRPKLLGDSARELGIRYFDFLIANHVVPRGAKHLTSEANIVVAQNALKTSRQSATLSHGAVAQRIGERAVCLFEPLESNVQNIDKALELLDEIFQNKTIFIVLSNTDIVDPEALTHISPICQKYHIPKTCLYIEQGDGTFINYLEDVNDFVPSRLNPFCMPQNFFSEMLDYAHNAYDEGDFEAVLRTVAPLIAPLCHRVRVMGNFPKILLAQALNLMGMTQRDIGNDNEAVDCFDTALNLLREIEDYEALKSVMANLGITLALSKPVTQPKIELAIRRLTEVTQLNPRDDEAWLYLANSYLELYRLTSAQSLLKRALRAYDKAYDLAPTDEIASCMAALEKQIGGRSSKRQSFEESQPQTLGPKIKENSSYLR